MGILTFKFQEQELSNHGFTRPNPDEEDSEFEEDEHGFCVRKICRIQSTNKKKDEELGEMRKRIVGEFSDIFTGSLKDSCMNMKPAEIVIDSTVKNTHKPATTSRDVPVFYKGAAKEHLKKNGG